MSLSLFLFLTRPPPECNPTDAPFPYPTLFRSEWLRPGPPTLDVRADGDRLLIRTTDGTNKGVSVAGRGESERWLTGAFGSNLPAWVAVLGVGLGDIQIGRAHV